MEAARQASGLGRVIVQRGERGRPKRAEQGAGPERANRVS